MLTPPRLAALALLLIVAPIGSFAAPSLTVRLDQPTAKVSPTLYGMMTEEINHSYDGGLYAELIQNRVFLDDADHPVHWTLLPGGKDAAMALDHTQPLSATAPVSLRLEGAASVANDGYWGVALHPATTYRASLYARGQAGTSLTVRLASTDGQNVWAAAQVGPLADTWKRFETTLTTPADLTASVDNRFVVASPGGPVWINLVSLFPPTFHDRPNGNRPDLMRMMNGLHPTFLRLPGGNFLEGDHVASRFNWKRTLGPLVEREGNPGCWKYRATDGLGLLEYLEWCEDLHMEPVLAVYSGFSLKQEFVPPGPELAPFVQEDIEEIEYVTGDAQTTEWGRRRAADGHPAPFPLHYVEIGNEDVYDKSKTYDDRFAQIYDGLKARYPDLKYIATRSVTTRQPDLIDDHFYSTAARMESGTHRFDAAKRDGPKIMIGEWATMEGSPTPDLNAGLGDAAFLTGVERNSDVIVLSCYAPLLANVNTQSPGVAVEDQPDRLRRPDLFRLALVLRAADVREPPRGRGSLAAALADVPTAAAPPEPPPKNPKTPTACAARPHPATGGRRHARHRPQTPLRQTGESPGPAPGACAALHGRGTSRTHRRGADPLRHRPAGRQFGGRAGKDRSGQFDRGRRQAGVRLHPAGPIGDRPPVAPGVGATPARRGNPPRRARSRPRRCSRAGTGRVEEACVASRRQG